MELKKVDKNRLLKACGQGDINTVKFYVGLGVNLNFKGEDSFANSPLHEAACGKQTEIFCLLVESGANILIRDGLGRTPLHRACYYGAIEIVKYLLPKMPTLDDLDGEGNTALHRAVYEGHTEVVKLLIDNGARVGVSNHRNENELMIANYWPGQEELVRILQEAYDRKK